MRHFTRRRMMRLVTAACVGLTGLTVYYFFNPLESRWMPQCIFRVVTGYECPGCGSQRFLHAMLHGNLSGAMESNALLVVLFPYLLYWGWVAADGETMPKNHRRMNSIPATLILLVMIIGWGILRNLVKF